MSAHRVLFKHKTSGVVSVINGRKQGLVLSLLNHNSMHYQCKICIAQKLNNVHCTSNCWHGWNVFINTRSHPERYSSSDFFTGALVLVCCRVYITYTCMALVHKRWVHETHALWQQLAPSHCHDTDLTRHWHLGSVMIPTWRDSDIWYSVWNLLGVTPG